MPILVLLRHGESVYNFENRFTGEMDIDLTKHGEIEAENAAKSIENIHFDLAFSSALVRAKHTLEIIFKQLGINIPIKTSSALNERNYGDLQGLDKAEVEKQFGPKQLMLWRRSYDISPPGGESLKETAERVIPYYESEIDPQLKSKKNILLVAHGNSLRALMMYLENISEQEICTTNIATGIPREYIFDDNLKLTSVKYLIST